MKDIQAAIEELRRGNIILVHDSEGRENETDMIAAAQHMTPRHVARMRIDGGGLICLVAGRKYSEKLELPFMKDILESARQDNPLLEHFRTEKPKYDKRSSFSLYINHVDTFTGISDTERALTISGFAGYCKKTGSMKDQKEVFEGFWNTFSAPGHVPLLRSSGLDNRQGHTELADALTEIAGLTQVAVVCEMLDENTHRSLGLEESRAYARDNGMTLIEGKDIITAYTKWQG